MRYLFLILSYIFFSFSLSRQIQIGEDITAIDGRILAAGAQLPNAKRSKIYALSYQTLIWLRNII